MEYGAMRLLHLFRFLSICVIFCFIFYVCVVMGEMLALAGIGAAQGAVNTAGNYLMIDAQKRAQKELQNEQNQFQKSENEIDRAWQEKE